MKKLLDSCSGRKSEIKMALQRLLAPPATEYLPRDLTLFPARIRGNGCFTVPIWTDSGEVFGRAVPDIRLLPGKVPCRNSRFTL